MKMLARFSLLALICAIGHTEAKTLKEKRGLSVIVENPSTEHGDMMGLAYDEKRGLVNVAAGRRRRGENWKDAENELGQFRAKRACGCSGYKQKRTGTHIEAGSMGDWDRWPGGVVSWKYVSGGPQVTAAVVRAALQKFEAKINKDGPCITFKELTNPGANDDYVKIYNGGSGVCNSYIGRIGYGQEMSLGDGCETEVVVQHEFMHALGFYHEHNRADRRHHVTVNFENVDSNACTSFEKCPNCRLFTPYNVKSIMQYPSYGFSCNGENTIVYKSDGAAISYNHIVQDTDVRSIRCLYTCVKPTDGKTVEDLCTHNTTSSDTTTTTTPTTT